MFWLLYAPGLLPACTPEEEPKDSEEQTDTIAFTIVDPSGPAVEGVVIAVDSADGTRVEVTTDADGAASVEMDIEDFAGAISHVDGRSFNVVTGALGRETALAGQAITMFSWSVDPGDTTTTTTAYTDWVTVSGSLLNKAELESSALVSTTIPSWYYQADETTTYEVTVPPGQAFEMVGLEFIPDANWGNDRVMDMTFLGWTVLDHEGVTEDTILDLDFADAAEPTFVSGSVPMPNNELLANEGAFYMELMADSAYVGFSPQTEVGEDEAHYNFEAEYLSLPDTDIWAWLSITTASGAGSWLILYDWRPVDGAQDPGMPEPPHRTAPTGTGPYAWNATVAWEGAEYPIISYWTDIGQVGVVYAATDEGSYTMPAFPSGSTRLAEGALYGEVAVCTSNNEDVLCEGWASEGRFEVESPF